MSKFKDILGLSEDQTINMLSNVYKNDVLEVFEKYLDKNILVFTFKDINIPQEKIELHSLANKYKVFVTENIPASIGSYYNKRLKMWQSILILDEPEKGSLEPRIEAETEPKAILKSFTEWFEFESYAKTE